MPAPTPPAAPPPPSRPLRVFGAPLRFGDDGPEVVAALSPEAARAAAASPFASGGAAGAFGRAPAATPALAVAAPFAAGRAAPAPRRLARAGSGRRLHRPAAASAAAGFPPPPGDASPSPPGVAGDPPPSPAGLARRMGAPGFAVTSPPSTIVGGGRVVDLICSPAPAPAPASAGHDDADGAAAPAPSTLVTLGSRAAPSPLPPIPSPLISLGRSDAATTAAATAAARRRRPARRVAATVLGGGAGEPRPTPLAPGAIAVAALDGSAAPASVSGRVVAALDPSALVAAVADLARAWCVAVVAPRDAAAVAYRGGRWADAARLYSGTAIALIPALPGEATTEGGVGARGSLSSETPLSRRIRVFWADKAGPAGAGALRRWEAAAAAAAEAAAAGPFGAVPAAVGDEATAAAAVAAEIRAAGIPAGPVGGSVIGVGGGGAGRPADAPPIPTPGEARREAARARSNAAAALLMAGRPWAALASARASLAALHRDNDKGDGIDQEGGGVGGGAADPAAARAAARLGTCLLRLGLADRAMRALTEAESLARTTLTAVAASTSSLDSTAVTPEAAGIAAAAAASALAEARARTGEARAARAAAADAAAAIAAVVAGADGDDTGEGSGRAARRALALARAPALGAPACPASEGARLLVAAARLAAGRPAAALATAEAAPAHWGPEADWRAQGPGAAAHGDGSIAGVNGDAAVPPAGGPGDALSALGDARAASIAWRAAVTALARAALGDAEGAAVALAPLCHPGVGISGTPPPDSEAAAAALGLPPPGGPCLWRALVPSPRRARALAALFESVARARSGGNVALAAGDAAAAAALYSAALTTPHAAPAVPGNPISDADTSGPAGFRRALAAARRPTGLGPALAIGPAAAARLLGNRAEANWRAGRAGDALADAARAAALDPGWGKAHARVAGLLESLGRPACAAERLGALESLQDAWATRARRRAGGVGAGRVGATVAARAAESALAETRSRRAALGRRAEAVGRAAAAAARAAPGGGWPANRGAPPAATIGADHLALLALGAPPLRAGSHGSREGFGPWPDGASQAAILGADAALSIAAVRRAYKRQALSWHPDKAAAALGFVSRGPGSSGDDRGWRGGGGGAAADAEAAEAAGAVGACPDLAGALALLRRWTEATAGSSNGADGEGNDNDNDDDDDAAYAAAASAASPAEPPAPPLDASIAAAEARCREAAAWLFGLLGERTSALGEESVVPACRCPALCSPPSLTSPPSPRRGSRISFMSPSSGVLGRRAGRGTGGGCGGGGAGGRWRNYLRSWPGWRIRRVWRWPRWPRLRRLWRLRPKLWRSGTAAAFPRRRPWWRRLLHRLGRHCGGRAACGRRGRVGRRRRRLVFGR